VRECFKAPYRSLAAESTHLAPPIFVSTDGDTIIAHEQLKTLRQMLGIQQAWTENETFWIFGLFFYSRDPTQATFVAILPVMPALFVLCQYPLLLVRKAFEIVRACGNFNKVLSYGVTM
jgi:hypothetical protein